MAADYSLQFPCEVRKIIPEAKLVQMVKHRFTAQFAVARFRDANPAFDPSGIPDAVEVQIAVRGPDGDAREVKATVAQLLAATAPLDDHRSACRDCRANVNDRPFGCIGKINYPIESVAEAWLVSRLPEDADSPSLSLLFKFLKELEVDGAPVHQIRSRSNILQSKSPATKTWGSWPNKKQISSDQLLQMLLFAGDARPQNAQLLTKLLNLSGVLSEPHPQSSNIEQFKSFFCALVMAGRLNCSVAIEA
jgi:hypothetical protein